jgi:hypothetical protein
MSTIDDSIDRADPGARAVARLETLKASERRRRLSGALALVLGGIALPFIAEPATGDPGATVGALVAGLLTLGLAATVWPNRWSPAELEHHRLDSIWHELRSDGHRELPWERYAAWADTADGSVVLGLVTRVPVERRVEGAPTPYRWHERSRLNADDMAAAAEAMERLRAEAAELELAAERRIKDAQSDAERRAHEQRLADIDRHAEAEARARDEALHRETAEQEAADRRAQAEGVARSCSGGPVRMAPA